jgi:hypothetical protein
MVELPVSAMISLGGLLLVESLSKVSKTLTSGSVAGVHRFLYLIADYCSRSLLSFAVFRKQFEN